MAPPATPPSVTCKMCLATIYAGTMRVTVKECGHPYHVSCRPKVIKLGGCPQCVVKLAGYDDFHPPHTGTPSGSSSS